MEKFKSRFTEHHKKIYEQLEFVKILELTANYACLDDSKEIILKTFHENRTMAVEKELSISDDICVLLKNTHIGIQFLENFQAHIAHVHIENYCLSLDCIKQIRILTENLHNFKTIQNQAKNLQLSSLSFYLDKFPNLSKLRTFLLALLTPDYEIKDSASEKLNLIRKQIQEKKSNLYKIFKKELDKYKNISILAEGEESVHNGKYVLRVKSEYKRKVPGVIAGESDSGKTAFIEPQVCIEYNNQLTELEFEERREIHRILIMITEFCRPYSEDLKSSFAYLVEFDILLSKANLALKLHAIKPRIQEYPVMKIEQGRHPLLYLKLESTGHPIVPLHIQADIDHRIVVISGPNAGGKSIALKTVGILHVMLQNGYLLPVGPDSAFYIFDTLFIDIGDGQSLDNDLSTYSAKLKFMQVLLKKANKESLFLIDEFGSGTDPSIGGAIAESVLESLIKQQSFGIITTHYSNLKVMAHKKKGLINASMRYDEEHMKPKFELELGKPGSSYAFDMAKKLRFPPDIISSAKKKINTGLVSFENLVNKLELEKSQLTKKNEALEEKMHSLNKLIKAYETLQKQHELKRVKLKLDIKQAEFQQVLERKHDINKMINEIESKLDIVAARRLADEMKTNMLQLETEIQSLDKTYHQLKRPKKQEKEFKPGDAVVLYKSNIKGTIHKIIGDEIEVITDFMTIRLSKDEIYQEEVKNEFYRKPKTGYDLVEKSSNTMTSVDLRGVVLSEATRSLEVFFDQVLVSGVAEFKIVHGKGTGVLRKLVHDYLKKNKFIKSWHHPDDSEGGIGTTIVELR